MMQFNSPLAGLCAIALLTGVAVTPAAAAPFQVVAHRGNSGFAPENTVASINAAAGIATHTEFDVRSNADGELIVMHDSTVDRTTDGVGSVTALTSAQIQGLDAGSWFSPAFAGEPVPTMTQAVSAAIGNGLVPMIERKAGTAAQFASALAGFVNDVTVISFDPIFLFSLNQINPNFNTGLLGSGALQLLDAQNAGVDFLSWQLDGLNASNVAQAHAAGLDVITWTLNSESQWQTALDYGVDGIVTDQPAALTNFIPEPASGVLLVLAAGVLAARRRRVA